MKLMSVSYARVRPSYTSYNFFINSMPFYTSLQSIAVNGIFRWKEICSSCGSDSSAGCSQPCCNEYAEVFVYIGSDVFMISLVFSPFLRAELKASTNL